MVLGKHPTHALKCGLADWYMQQGGDEVSTREYGRILREELKRNRGEGTKPPTSRLWPVKANLPVPFSSLRELYAVENLNDLVERVLSVDAEWARHFRRCLDGHKDDQVFHARLDEELRRIEAGLCRVRDTKIVALVADGDLLEGADGNQEDDENSNIAVFISRINQGGVRGHLIDGVEVVE